MKKEKIQLKIDGKTKTVYRAVRHYYAASQYILLGKERVFVEFDQKEQVWKNAPCGGSYAS